MSKTRKNYTAKEKVEILKKHLIDKIPVSQLCQQNQLNPNVFYRWQKEFFQNGDAAFEKTRSPKVDPREKKIQLLQQKLTQKNEVLAELMQEHLLLKKELGEL